jgi:peptidyl-prolyl cis-trans isomerase A (cyclophilin A)
MNAARSTAVSLCLGILLLAAPAGADTTAGGAPVPSPKDATATAPATYKVKMATTKGDFTIEVHRDWAPLGADRFYNLVKLGYYDDVAFFRVVKGFMVQLGISGNPAANRVWRTASFQDDPSGKKSNTKGMVTFATAGPDMRTTQIFINYGNNARLDSMGFAPFGKVVDGMKVVDAIEGMYGEGAPEGRGPQQERIQMGGNDYLKKDFPKLDYVKKATIVP